MDAKMSTPVFFFLVFFVRDLLSTDMFFVVDEPRRNPKMNQLQKEKPVRNTNTDGKQATQQNL